MKVKHYELLAPAGNFEKLKVALHYGADAVYMGIPELSLRGKMKDMNLDVLKQSIDYVKKHQKKIYVTMNIFPHNKDISLIIENLKIIEEIKPHAMIFSDPGVYRLAKKYAPSIPLHISTQANVTNVESAKFWEELGIERIILAREVSIEEIKEFRQNIKIDLEAFVHGSMCIAYSGKCYLSAYMTNRSANHGECTNSCRWKYSIYYLKEETRDGQYFPVYEDDRGTYIMSSKDLCMIEYLPLLANAGVNSFKIEGRMKGINYLAGVIKTYREALDLVEEGKFEVKEKWLKELNLFSNRGYTTGMYFGSHPEDGYQHDHQSRNIPELSLAGIVKHVEDDGVWILARDKVYLNDEIVFLNTKLEDEVFTIKEIKTSNKTIDILKNGDMAKLILNKETKFIQPDDIIRKSKVYAQ